MTVTSGPRDRFVALFLSLLAAQVLVVATTMSVTCDETGHLGGGLYSWDHGKFDVYRVNPPLVRMLACAPVALCNPNRDYKNYAEGPATRVEWRLGQDLIAVNPDDWEWYFTFGRWAVMPLTLIGAWFVWRWSSDLAGTAMPTSSEAPARTGASQTRWGVGSACGLVSLSLYCFCPNIVAWSGTFTPDAAAAALGIAAGYSFWKWLRTPTWSRAVAAGAWLGLAELTKFSWIILFPLWPLLWLMWRLTAPRFSTMSATCMTSGDETTHADGVGVKPASPASDFPTQVATFNPSFRQLTAILLLALYAINLGYGFEGSLTQVKDFVFVSRTLAGKDSKADQGSGGNRFKESWIGQIPVPLPFNYLRGIDLQKVDFEEGKTSYLNGEWSERGWWYYYLYAATLKVPLGTWLLGLFVVGLKVARVGIRRKSSAREPRAPHDVTWRDEVVVLAPAVVLFVLVSSQTGFSRYFRYVLPCFPFLYVWLGQAGRLLAWEPRQVDSGMSVSERPTYVGRYRWLGWLVSGALAWSIVSSLSVFPHSMSYFNELAGGPRNGHFYLVDANIDWGQDMYFLRRWLKKHPEATPLHVAQLCFVHPRHYGIESKTPPEIPMPGWFAMSIHRIHGERGTYNFFLHYEPVALAGYSIYIYHVTLDEANRVRRELGYPELPSQEYGGPTPSG